MSKINKVKSQMSKINKVKCQMSKINKVKCQKSIRSNVKCQKSIRLILTERTSGVPPVIFFCDEVPLLERFQISFDFIENLYNQI